MHGFVILMIICIFWGGCKEEFMSDVEFGDRLSTDSGSETLINVDTLFQPEITIGEGASNGKLACSEVRLEAHQVRRLSKVVVSDGTAGIIFPGAILQGSPFERGNFTPVTVPKAGGQLIMEGITGAESVTISVPSFQWSDVSEGINDMLDIQGPVSTAADFSYILKETYSRDEFRFNLGLDARYGLGEIESKFEINKKIEGSRVIIQFYQTFYTISINDPETKYSLFKEGDKVKDIEHQIGPNNPPLYVKSVDYGRQIYFMVESKFSTEDVKASLLAAYEGKLAGFKLSSGVEVGTVLKNSKVTYIVYGGGAEIALKGAPSYEKVQNVIQEGAEWSLNNPGVPIAYSLRYLASRRQVHMSYEAEFNRKTCELDPVEVYKFSLHKITCIKCKEGRNEFGGNATISTSRNATEYDINVLMNEVPNKGSKFYSEGRDREFIFDNPTEDDYFRISTNLYERDPNNRIDDFGRITRNWKFSNAPNKIFSLGNPVYYSFIFDDKTGTINHQRVELVYKIERKK